MSRRTHRHAVAAIAALSLAGIAGAVGSASATTAPPDDMTMSGPSGPLCAAVPTDGEGSVAGMADDAVGTAASNNPLLTTLVAAVTAADLGHTLNGPGPFTVFAPVNSAFDKIDPATLEGVLADVDTLTSILTYHVVPEQLSSADLVSGGTFATANGAELTIAHVGETLVVNGGAAAVQCADVPIYKRVVCEQKVFWSLCKGKRLFTDAYCQQNQSLGRGEGG